jgi:hypothetical protein
MPFRVAFWGDLPANLAVQQVPALCFKWAWHVQRLVESAVKVGQLDHVEASFQCFQAVLRQGFAAKGLGMLAA